MHLHLKRPIQSRHVMASVVPSKNVIVSRMSICRFTAMYYQDRACSRKIHHSTLDVTVSKVMVRSSVCTLTNLPGADLKAVCCWCSLDTGRLDKETYELFDRVEKHYSIQIEYTFPDAQETMDLVRAKGMFSFYEDGHQECCRVRKVSLVVRL